ncbi:MAG: protein-L-isoaspartate(D-aspartate) O-methyltransferase [Candidatus Aenigmatarchaeota archaeon]
MNLEEKKKQLIDELITEGFLKTPEIISAFRSVTREDFVPNELRSHAYDNCPLPIAEGQTISQPLTVAVMTEALQPRKGNKILEVGAGSGYQAAILAEIIGQKGQIITTEIIKSLAEFASENIKKCGYENVVVINEDGSVGYKKYMPYDRIIVTASAPAVPQQLVNQLKDNGRLVIPVGDEMFLVEKTDKKFKKTSLGYYVFVPLKGRRGW